MSIPILSDITGQYGEFFKATDKFFNKIATYSERIIEETEKTDSRFYIIFGYKNKIDEELIKQYSPR